MEPTKVYAARTFLEVCKPALSDLLRLGESVAPRGQPTTEAPGPVVLQTSFPAAHAFLIPNRGYNYAFAHAELLWILAGRADAELPAFFASRLKGFAELDGSLHGAYGRRLFEPEDQLQRCVEILTDDPRSRRAVAAIWRREEDLQPECLDYPCNTQLQFLLRGERLALIVSRRSADAALGLPGDHLVFRVLQCLVARSLGAEAGDLVEVIGSLHLYTELYPATFKSICAWLDNETAAQQLFIAPPDLTLAAGRVLAERACDLLDGFLARSCLSEQIKVADAQLDLLADAGMLWATQVLNLLCAYVAFQLAGEAPCSAADRANLTQFSTWCIERLNPAFRAMLAHTFAGRQRSPFVQLKTPTGEENQS